MNRNVRRVSELKSYSFGTVARWPAAPAAEQRGMTMRPSLKHVALSASLALGLAAPALASAQDWNDYGYSPNQIVTKCDSDGDRCATFRCDPDGDACDRISGWRQVNRYRGEDYDDWGYGAYGNTMTRCDSDGDRCATFRCDSDGDRCTRTSRWWWNH